jgi:hypothetical protein
MSCSATPDKMRDDIEEKEEAERGSRELDAIPLAEMKLTRDEHLLPSY